MSIDVQYAEFCQIAYRIILLVLTIVIAISYNSEQKFCNRNIAKFLGPAIIIFFAIRPLTHYFGFGDTEGYAFFFNLSKNYKGMDMNAKDIGFEFISYNLRSFDVSALFFTMACLYVIPQIIVSKKLSPQHYGILFFIIVCSFSYWGYGVNGMRNGTALSLVTLGMVMKNKIWTPLLFLSGISIHSSALLPCCAYLLCFVYNKPKFYIVGWGICLILSLFVSRFLTETLNISDFIKDDRVSYLTKEFDSTSGTFSSTGYRWDFVLYSVIPIIIGANKILNDGFTDKLYLKLYNTYIICNAFWLFTIYIPYNNRFAYLSWFLYPIIISYPYLRHNIIPYRDIPIIKRTILINYLFTFIMWLR